MPAAPAELARRLLAYEAGESRRSEDIAAAGERVYLRLRERLAVLLGSAGFDALWARAMHLAPQKFGASDQTAAEQSLASRVPGLDAAIHGRDTAAVQHNLVIAFASFITLLFTLIGEELGVRFIRQIWPDLPPEVAASRADGAHNE